MLGYLLFLQFEGELTRAIIPLFPDEPDKSFGFYRDFLRLCFQEMLWVSFFFLLAWFIGCYVPLSQIMKRIERHIKRRQRIYLGAIASASFIAALFVASYILRTFPNSADEYAYLYQAITLSEGKLTQRAHPLQNFFHFNHIAQKDGISVGRFPPGWPLLLSVPFILHVQPYWLNAILGSITILLVYNFARRLYGQSVAIWSSMSLALSSYFIFNSASYFSHSSCLLFTVAFVYCIYLDEEKTHNRYALLAGGFLGLILITRYFNALLILFPIAVSLLYRHRGKGVSTLLFVVAGCVPCFAFLCWYNYEITGNALSPVTVWADPTETIGFVKGHTFARGVEYTLRRLLLFVYWCSPALVILYFVFLLQKILDRATRLVHAEDYFLLFLLIGYFFYHHLGGNQYGPRFWFEAFPFVIIFVVDRAQRINSVWPSVLIACSLLYSVLKMPYIMEREHRVVNERLDLYLKVKEAGIDNAVVLVTTHTGVIRPMPIRDLTRNNMDYTGSVIYAQDQKAGNELLMDYYSNRSFYKYVRDREKVEGWLIKVR